MFYKNLLGLKLKLAIWAVAYGLIVWGFRDVSGLVGQVSESKDYMFEGAQTILFLLSILLPILGGADFATSQTKKGTLDFLTNRGNQVDTGRLVANWAGWAGIYLTTSVILGLMLSPSIAGWFMVVAILAMGTAIMGLAAAASIITRNNVKANMLSGGIAIASTIVALNVAQGLGFGFMGGLVIITVITSTIAVGLTMSKLLVTQSNKSY